ncbi:MAG: hypothetical protein ACLPN6_02585 [Streptosporangiaceae bacterium]
MFTRSQDTGTQETAVRGAGSASAGAGMPDRACCCSARPMVLVELPPTTTRPLPADLWLCGHHYRKSHAALTDAGARVSDVSGQEQH